VGKYSQYYKLLLLKVQVIDRFLIRSYKRTAYIVFCNIVMTERGSEGIRSM
jgi:hypothetical protein